MNKSFLRIAFIFALLSVALGAFAAHGLKQHLSEYQINIFQTGVRYQFYHSFALIASWLLAGHLSIKYIRWAAWSFIIGILFFSGSLYGLACHELLGIENKSILGPMTPIGGLFFIIGWLMLIIASYSKK